MIDPRAVVAIGIVALAACNEDRRPPRVATAPGAEPSRAVDPNKEPIATLPEHCDEPSRVIDADKTPWRLRIADTRYEPCVAVYEGPPSQCRDVHEDWELQFVGPNGVGHGRAMGTTKDQHVGLPGGSEERISLAGAFDYDGDGIPEVFVVFDWKDHVTHQRRRVSIWKYANGSIERFGTTRDGWQLEDADCDGRPDLVLPSACPCGPEDAATEYRDCLPPHQIVHARADGTFSEDDGVARARPSRCPASGSAR